jgi:penicillin G amidase
VLLAIETLQHQDLLLATLKLAEDEPPQQWGDLHHAYFEHPLASLWGDKYDVGRFAMSGSISSPMNMGYRGDFRVMWGASVRLIMDVGAWDNSLCINTTGQSGDPRSPHYRDLAPLWAAGDYVPLAFSDEAVEAVTKNIITLNPISF